MPCIHRLQDGYPPASRVGMDGEEGGRGYRGGRGLHWRGVVRFGVGGIWEKAEGGRSDELVWGRGYLLQNKTVSFDNCLSQDITKTEVCQIQFLDISH